MTEYKEAAFMADLLLGTESHLALDHGLDDAHYETLYTDARHLAEIAKRVRAQTRHIVKAVRLWDERHDELRHPLKRKYSAYEGMLCRQDLRQHLILYRHVVREYHQARRLCNASVPDRRARRGGKLRKSKAA